MSHYALLLALLSLLYTGTLVSSQFPTNLTLTFTLQTGTAPWMARFAGTVEQLPIAIIYNGQTYPSGSFVIHGGTGNVNGQQTHFNDVWVSSNKGVSWTQINTGASSYAPTWMAGYTKDNAGRLYRTGGARGDGTFSNEVWRSDNGGVSWARQIPDTPGQAFPGRTFPEIMSGSKDQVFVATGLTGTVSSGPGLNDVWQSTDFGKNWVQMANLPFSAPPGRSSASLLQHSAPAMAYRSVLWYMGGYSRYENGQVGYHNDVYISSDNGDSWKLITANAPWQKRDNFNAEVTNSGIIVLSSGYNQEGSVGRNNLNDVWASMDGGWTWGQCVEDAPFSDRRWQMTLLDNDGYFYVIGGDEGYNNASTQRVPKNDVWRSQWSFNDIASMSRLCGLTVPVCGVGLYCLPGSETRIVNGQVRCPATDLCTSQRMGFRPVTMSAQWTPRHTAGLEMLRTSMNIVGRSWPAGSMVLWGGVGRQGTNNDAMLNDVWISSDYNSWSLVSQNQFEGSAFSGHAADSKNRLYKVAGERWGGPGGQYVHGDVFMSANGGVTWTKQTPSVSTRALPKRGFPDVYADMKDHLYAIGGLDNVGGNGLNDVWRSSNQGRDWTLQGNIPFGAGGRSSGALLIHYSRIMQKDVLTYIGGYSRLNGQGRYFNDIWVSSNEGRAWVQLTASAPFAERDNFNAEVTDDGLLIIAGGYNNREALNDVWISGDGGYSWGQCNSQAQFSDRRWQMTVLDNDGALLVVGGEEVESGRYVKQNDVWRSTISLQSTKYSLRYSCPGVQFSSKCDIGLNCWPKSGTSSPWRPNAAATCIEDQRCSVPDPDAPTGDNGGGGGGDDGGDSTGTTDSNSGGLSTGAIVLIVILVIAGVGGILGYFWHKRKQAPEYSRDQGLLGTTDSASDSTATL